MVAGENVGKQITQPSNGVSRVDTFNLARSWSNMSNTGSGLSVSSNNNTPLLSATSTEQINAASTETRKPFMPSSWQMSRANITGGLDSIAVGAPRGQPIVGSIFGSAEGSSQTINQNVVDRSSIDQEPSRDFMASFLNPKNGPLRTLNLGKQSVEIVPIGSDMSKANINANNMFIVGRGKASSVFEPSVTDFGISEVYTRKQELDANQWNTFLKSISQDSNTRRNNVPYQTQNILSSSAVRPLDAIDLNINTISNPTASLTVDPKPMVSSNPSISVLLNSGKGQGANLGPDFVNTMFAAPGIGGHRSIPIPTVMTRPDVAVLSSSSAGRTNRIVTDTSRNTHSVDSGSSSMSSSSILSPGSSRSVDSVFEHTIDVQKRLFEKFIGSQGNDPSLNGVSQRQNTGLVAQATRTADSAPVPTASLSVQQQSNTRVDRRPVNSGKTADHFDFKLGKSILIADGVIPNFVQDTQQSLVSTSDLQNMASSGFRLGEPVVMTRSDVTQGNDFTSVRSIGGVQSPNVNPTSSTLGLVITQDFGNANTAVSGEQPSSRDTAVVNKALSSVQRAAIAASGSTAEATKFTSGNRIAAFGPANGADERAVNRMLERSYKPAKAMRMGILGPVSECRYKPDPQSQYYFIYKNGATEHRFRCALGTAFDEMTCECSIRVSDHDDCLEVHMDFNNGVVEDSSLNNLPIGNENVEITNSSSPLAGIALFGGDGKLTIWRYQNYDFRNHIMLKVQFRPGPGGDRIQTLISNCGSESPSIAILYDTNMKEAVLILKTDNDTQKDLRFKIDPTEWNDVTYIYDGMEFIGIVNGVRRYVSKQDPHLLGIIGGEIKSVATKGLIEIRDSAVTLGQCPLYGSYIGAMVDIQIYTCIPRDFRLE
ncbi:uncharacterized protein LOC127836592 isoform X1 [Dreissena polymorpha]|nr:uncharacterized protein LOC127836592 isoform X1 [Dreissena polymorpha]